MSVNTVLMVGGSGFLGRSVAAHLARKGIRIRIPTRRPPIHSSFPATAEFVDVDVNDAGVLPSLLNGVDAVINLVGILHDRDGRAPFGPRFNQAHVELPRQIAVAMQQNGVRRLLHVSALRASPEAPSAYLRSKAAGEAVLFAVPDLEVTVFRPSVIFGPGDAFLNLFAQLLRVFPVLPLAGASARFQPVFVDDVAAALVDALTRSETVGLVYELGGPAGYHLQALVEYVAAQLGRRRWVLPLPGGLAYWQARFLENFPNPPMSVDNLRSMQVDSVTDGLHDYPGWQPRSLESVAPSYLGRRS